MEKAINTKTKKINVIYGFFNDDNYGVDYPTLIDSIELVDFFPYINEGEQDITADYGMTSALFAACSDLEGNAWDNLMSFNGEAARYTFYANIRTLKNEPTISVCFRIVKNAA